MELYRKRLTDVQIGLIVNRYGTYFKVSCDIQLGLMVVGCRLHADALPLLKKNGSLEKDIWGGWMNMDEKMVETNAVLNIRDDNPSMEILDNDTRDKFKEIVTGFFQNVFG